MEHPLLLLPVHLLAWLALPQAPACAQGSWSPTNIPSIGRYDDVFFVNADTGWAAGGGEGTIYRTNNGGATWTLQYDSPWYLRSIEFVNDTLGFSGSLQQALYRTADGGTTWTDISAAIQPSPVGICGLSAPGGGRVYGCGIWSSPAFVIRSDDNGLTWSYTDMSVYAQALVDIHFTSPDTGFATGTSIVEGEGGLVLRTTDGGATWQSMYTTGVPGDIIWKYQNLDGQHCFGSVYGVGVQQDTRMIRSSDGGLIWETRQVADHYTYTEGLGFIDALRGWVGGDAEFFSTVDGGDTWVSTVMGAAHNRFFRINAALAYFSGERIYKYSADPTGTPPPSGRAHGHALRAHVEPDGAMVITIELVRPTTAVLDVLSSDGRLVQRLLFDRKASDTHQYRVPAEGLPKGVALITLATNEGLLTESVVLDR